jgi:uncharacterized membrane protein YdfJ with MMPL/SSD domain
MDKPHPDLSGPVAADQITDIDEATKRRAQAEKVARDRVIARKTIEQLGGGSYGSPATAAQTERKAAQRAAEAMARYRRRKK